MLITSPVTDANGVRSERGNLDGGNGTDLYWHSGRVQNHVVLARPGGRSVRGESSRSTAPDRCRRAKGFWISDGPAFRTPRCRGPYGVAPKNPMFLPRPRGPSALRVLCRDEARAVSTSRGSAACELSRRARRHPVVARRVRAAVGASSPAERAADPSTRRCDQRGDTRPRRVVPR